MRHRPGREREDTGVIEGRSAALSLEANVITTI